MTEAPWKSDPGPGCRKIKGGKNGRRKQAQYTEVAFTVGLHDDKTDAANAIGIATLRNHARNAAALLREAAEEVEQLRSRVDSEAEYQALTDNMRMRPVYEAAMAWRRNRGPRQSGPLTERLESAIDAALTTASKETP
jgi:hypothetical protein